MAHDIITEWPNEHRADDYPLTAPFKIQSLFVDAHFIGFDNALPILRSIVVGTSSLTINLRYVTDMAIDVVYDELITGDVYVIPVTDIGRLILSVAGVYELETQYMGQTLTANIEFSPLTVDSLDSESGVYGINSKTGAITFDATIQATTENPRPLSVLCFDAVSGQINTALVSAIYTPSAPPFLKTINGMRGKDNNYTIMLAHKIVARTVSESAPPATEYTLSGLKISEIQDGISIGAVQGTNMTAVSSKLYAPT